MLKQKVIQNRKLNNKEIDENVDFAIKFFKNSFRIKAKIGDVMGFSIKRKHFIITRDE